MKNTKSFNVQKIETDDFTTYKIYTDIFNIPDNKGNTGKRGKAVNKEKSIAESVRRAKTKIKGYILANNWEYWATQTFDPKRVDRFDLDTIIMTYNKRLQNIKSRKYDNLQWLIVPEQHKDKAWHLHMFINGIPKDKIVYSGKNYYNDKNQFVRRIYNWIDTIEYGFNDYVYIGDINAIEKRKIANYIMKYITKDLARVRFNKKMYWCTRGLHEPEKENILLHPDELEDFKKWLNDPEASQKLLLHKSNYQIKSNVTGEIFNSVDDLTMLNLK